MELNKNFYVKTLKSILGVDFIPEYKFHPKRKWRMDFALVEHKICIEIEGGLFLKGGGGRHNRPLGMIADMEKYNTAVSMGWHVLRTIPQNATKTKFLALVEQTILFTSSQK